MSDPDRYIEAPQSYRYDAADPVAVFLAGGISNCPDWQAVEAKALLEAGLIVLNPRRARYQLGAPDAVAQQVAWEYTHLNDLPRLLTLFWFPATDPAVTVQPIALLELGRATANPPRPGHHLVVGADPAYPRRVDVELQLRNARPALTATAWKPPSRGRGNRTTTTQIGRSWTCTKAGVPAGHELDGSLAFTTRFGPSGSRKVCSTT